MKKPILAAGATLLLLTEISAQLDVNAVLRPRTEYRHGYKTLVSGTDDPAFFTSQRTRLNVAWGAKKIRIMVSFQDIRTWGNTSQLSMADGLTSLYQGWAEADLGEKIQLRVGRQELIYNDHRIFGNVGWAQQGRSHDLALLKIDPGSLRLHVGFAYNQDTEQLTGNIYTVPNNYKTMQFLWAGTSLSGVELSALFLNNGIQYLNPGDSSYATVYSQTAGLHGDYAASGLKLSGSAYYQFGKDGMNRDLGAYQLALRASYAFADRKWVPSFGLEILSGTDQSVMVIPGNTTNRSFTPFYGTNHKFNGHMDYFYVGNHVNSVGLADIYTGLSFNPGKFNWNLMVHRFSSQAEILDPADPGSILPKSLGTELDFYMGYKYSDLLTINAGYSQMFATASMEALKGGDRSVTQNWTWVMISITPKLVEMHNSND
jgi:hypothetical protein